MTAWRTESPGEARRPTFTSDHRPGNDGLTSACVAPNANGTTGGIADPHRSPKRYSILTDVSRSEFAITETEDNAIAAAAIIGDNRSPVIG